MDAISFIASIAQLAGAGLSLSKSLYDYASSVSNAPKKLNDLAQDVGLTSSVLEHLSEVFSEATVRAFVRPGALKTAQDAIAGCSEIFAEMETLIEDGRKGLGKYILPFKETKIQLLNARLASLKSTLQLLLQVLQYASSVNIDPNVSQLSLNGTWVMSQFKRLIDEREEAKRNFEQLKAEIGSISSGIGEPSSSSIVVQQKSTAPAESDSFIIQSAPPPGESPHLKLDSENEIELTKHLSPQSIATYPATNLLLNSTSNIETSDSILKRTDIKPTIIDAGTPSCIDIVTSALNSLMYCIGTIICCPCCAGCSRKNQNRRSSGASPGEATSAPQANDSNYSPFLYPGLPLVASLVYNNLQEYGPEGLYEIAGNSGLPAPQTLSAYYRR